MCGRYVLALRYGQVHEFLDQHGLPADDFHEEEAHRQRRRGDRDGRQGEDEGGQEPEEDGAGQDTQDAEDADNAKDSGDAIFQPSYNFAPGYHGIVLRPVFPRKDDQPTKSGKTSTDGLHLQLQVMKWGLVPSWMKKRPDYATMLKTINCRADSLVPGSSGMWAGLRGRKRCVVIAQGFYEWLKVGPNGKERVPHYIRRRDGLPLLLAGLWDSVAFEDDKKGETTARENERTYTYTIITTDSNASLKFLHDRMPVVFDYGSPELHMWLDTGRDAWSHELQTLLRPWPRMAEDDGAALITDVVSKEVNKAGHSSPSYIVPVASEDNKSNIANFFRGKTEKVKGEKTGAGVKRETQEEDTDQPAKKTRLESPSKSETKPTTPIKDVGTRPTNTSFSSSTKAGQRFKGTKSSPSKKEKEKDAKSGGSQKITSFFGLKNG